ncbi:unnamed protein product [Rotaria sp. Silwood1]|nr:unnamed protein product [Rotaria sp. Silwood1]CAF3420662.1 unnamed protein product [Rotaria sp. Silwood1]CAF3432374.1 unnamed protein product [Rotaria sp. Silwood1]CAF3434092.1 unnamed protein product [Rotaria sp. Silwood1]CAF4656561.1 unnamed protein product [Rotaria sp. Silwood1]
MMRKNAASFYPPPYKATPFNGMPNNFGVGPPSVPSFYNLQLQHGQQQQQQQQPKKQQRSKKHLINEQNHDNTIPNIPSFKLYDLDTNDNNEIIRLIFSFADVSYKNKLLTQDEWIRIKEHMLFEHLPILRINHDFKIFQLHAIIRYLAREFHLYGTGQHDHAIVDIIHETVREFREKIFQQNNNSSANNEQTLHQLIADHSTTYLKQLENFYEIFNRRGPFYLGSHVSLADLIVYDTINHLVKIDTKLLDNYSHLKDAYRRLEKHPRLSNYMNIKTNNNEIQKYHHHHHRSPQSRRHATKSPLPNIPPHQHRHRSHEGSESGHYHYHHHHHHHHPHHRRHSKEPTPLLQTKQRSMISSKSPTISRKEIEPPPPIPPTKQQLVRSSQSPRVSTKDIESSPPIPQTKQRPIRTSKSPSSSRKDKEPTPLRATDVIPPPPPPPIPQPPPPPSIINEHKN